MSTFVQLTKISLALLFSFVATVSAQNRPAPEPAPVIDLPEPAVEEVGVAQVIEDEIDEEVPQHDGATTIETNVEVIAGSEPSKMVRWPSQRGK